MFVGFGCGKVYGSGWRKVFDDYAGHELMIDLGIAMGRPEKSLMVWMVTQKV